MSRFKDNAIGVGGVLLSILSLLIGMAIWGACVLIALILGGRLLHFVGLL